MPNHTHSPVPDNQSRAATTTLWIESHIEIGRHPKTRRLARTLGVSIPTAVGHLHLLWHFAMEFAPSGDVSKFPEGDIEDAVMWEGKPGAMFQALWHCGWLDVDDHDDDDVCAEVHDWDIYAGRLLEQREKNREKSRRYRERLANRDDDGDLPYTEETPNGDVTVTSPSRNPLTVPNRTVPNQTQPNTTEPETTRARTATAVAVVADSPYAIFAVFLEETGTVEDTVAPAWKKRQLGIAKGLAEQGYGEDKVRRCTRYMKSQDWRTSPFDLAAIAGYIGTWEAGGMPLVDAPRSKNSRGSPASTSPDFTGIQAVSEAWKRSESAT